MTIGLPARRFHLALVGAALMAAVSVPLALLLAAVVVVVGLVDLWVAKRATVVELRADAPAVLHQGEGSERGASGAPVELRLVLENRGRRPVRVQVAIDLPPELAGADAGATKFVLLLPREKTIVAFELVARERGHHVVAAVHLRLLAPLQLVWRQEKRALAVAIDVHPALARERRRGPLWSRARREGVRAVRRRGDHGEFESLRNYVRGDDPRRIDWKATARRRIVTVRNYQDERSQNLMLVIDAGRLMLERVDGRSRLDWAVAAATALVAAAREWRDHVGVMIFSDTVQALVPPAQHPPERLPRLLALSEARPVEPDYPRALVTLARTLRRRSLIVLLGDVIDAEVSAPVAVHLAQLAGRHLPLFVALRAPQLQALASAPIADRLDLARRAAATELVIARQKTLESMRRAGIQVVDALPATSLAALVDQYVRIKRGGAL